MAGLAVLALAEQIKCTSSNRFHIPNLRANWHRATEYCFSLGMQLAIADSEEDHTKMVKFISESEVYNNESTVVWIGASDLAQEGVFYWHASGQRLRYTNWRSDNPDDFGGQEDCVNLVNIPASGWHWHANDAGCIAAHYFICENVHPKQAIELF
ncbi:collectin-10-like [Sabethes cyaneus]|uniref:collectin-10-like n=1 Tax=Sabethes cyaneus TaxID=53552 RepID=UPI00237E2E26|nr:collectin-10-like [Sabethes cyaneus]